MATSGDFAVSSIQFGTLSASKDIGPTVKQSLTQPDSDCSKAVGWS